MSSNENITEAERLLQAGKAKKALRLLWREKVDAAVRGDAVTLERIIALASEVANRPGGGSAVPDARSLAASAAAELRYLAARGVPAPSGQPPPAGPSAAGTRADVGERLDRFEARLRELEGELLELRAVAAGARFLEAPPEPGPGWEAEASPEPELAPEPAPAQPEVAWTPTPPRRPRVSTPSLTLPDLDARALAWAGGVVTLLGIVFLSVLAANRGWISPELRVVAGAIISLGLFAGAIEVRRRYGNLQAALAAAGAAIGGAYATLAAAAALYEFVSKPEALLAAAGVAAAGVALALTWNAQMTAALGLVGAMLGPAVLERDVTVLGSGFVAIVLAATVAVTVWKGWLETMVAAALASAPLVAVLLAEREPGEDVVTALLGAVFSLLYLGAAVGNELRPPRLRYGGEFVPVVVGAFLVLAVGVVLGVVVQVRPSAPAGVVVILAAAWLVYLGSGVALQLRGGQARLRPAGTALLLASLTVAFATTLLRFEGRAEGFALLAVAAVYLLVLALVRTRANRDLASVLWGVALAVVAVAVGDLLSGSQLALVWSAQGALLAWLAARLREPRLQLASAAYLALALGHAVLLDAPPEDLFVASEHPAAGAAAVAYVAVAAAFAGWMYRPARHALVAFLVAAFAALYSVSLALLELFVALEEEARTVEGFERGHPAVTSLWGVVALVLLAAAVRRRSGLLHQASLALFALTVLKLAGYDASYLGEVESSFAGLAVGALALAAGLLHGLKGARFVPARVAGTLDPVTLTFLAASLASVLAGLVQLLDGEVAGIDQEGLGLLGAATVYGALGAWVFAWPRERDLATALWAPALGLAAFAAAELLSGPWLALAWSAGAALLAGLAPRVREERLTLASLVYLVLGVGYAVSVEAPPSDLFDEVLRPAAGVPSLVFATLATYVFAYFLTRIQERNASFWTAGALSVYAASLAILGLFQWVAADNGESVHTAFQRGQTAVSSFWGVIGLVLLTVGLRRGWGGLRLGGLALFAVALGKIFLFDLSYLSSVARALSFLAVGSILLLAAFVYQRVSEPPSRA